MPKNIRTPWGKSKPGTEWFTQLLPYIFYLKVSVTVIIKCDLSFTQPSVQIIPDPKGAALQMLAEVTLRRRQCKAEHADRMLDYANCVRLVDTALQSGCIRHNKSPYTHTSSRQIQLPNQGSSSNPPYSLAPLCVCVCVCWGDGGLQTAWNRPRLIIGACQPVLIANANRIGGHGWTQLISCMHRHTHKNTRVHAC